MKKFITLMAVGSISVLSAQCGSCPSCNNGGYYQDQSYGYPQQQQGYQGQVYGQNPQYVQQQQRNDNWNNQQGYANQPQQRDMRDAKGSTDQDLDKSIRNALGSGWFTEGYKGVTFDVNNGNVILRGTVDTLENRNKVEDSVRKIKGVSQVINQINVSPAAANKNAWTESQLRDSEKKYPQDSAATPADRQINAKIHDKLSGGMFSKGVDLLVIRTANGVVVITGAVDKQDDVQKVNDQLKDIEGIKSVNNQLSVKNT